MRVEPDAARPAPAPGASTRRPRSRRRAKAGVWPRACPPAPGAASGKVVFNARRRRGVAAKPARRSILVRIETSPEDIGGMGAAAGHPDGARRHDQPRGGRRPRMGKVCVAGCEALCDRLQRARTITVGGKVREGRRLDLASTAPPARCIVGRSRPASEVVQVLVEKSLKPEESDVPVLRRLMGWADECRKLGVRTNADSPSDADSALAVRRRGHRPVPHRAHVLRAATASTRVREMILARDAGGARDGAGQAAADAARRLRRHLPGDGRAAR